MEGGEGGSYEEHDGDVEAAAEGSNGVFGKAVEEEGAEERRGHPGTQGDALCSGN